MWGTWAVIFKRAPKIDEKRCSARRRRRDLIELTGIYTLILLVIWTPHPWQWGLWGVASVCVASVIAVSFDGWRTMGLCTKNLWCSLWVVALAMVLAVALVMAAEYQHTLRLPASPTLFLRHYGWYALWAGLQQVILQCVFLSRTLRLIPNTLAAAGLSAGLFAIAHLPNPVLTAVTLICGLASCLFFVRYRNLWPLAIAHAILGIAIAVAIPGNRDHNMRVGISYWTWVDKPVVSEAVPLPMP